MSTSDAWKQVRHRFETLLANGAHSLEASGTDLVAGSPAASERFRLLAMAAARMARGKADAGLTTWLGLLRERLRPLHPSYFSVERLVSSRSPTRLIPLSKINLPVESGTIPRGGGSEARVRARALIEAVERTAMHLVVYVEGQRFGVIPEARVIAAAYATLRRKRARCVVIQPDTSPAPRHDVREFEVIHQVCRASVELCQLLEDEAFASEQAPSQESPRILSTDRREARKRETLERHEGWRSAHNTLRERRPNMSKSWYASHIARQPEAEGRSAATIRKHLTP